MYCGLLEGKLPQKPCQLVERSLALDLLQKLQCEFCVQCEFCDYLDQAMRDRAVFSIRSEKYSEASTDQATGGGVSKRNGG